MARIVSALSYSLWALLTSNECSTAEGRASRSACAVLCIVSAPLPPPTAYWYGATAAATRAWKTFAFALLIKRLISIPRPRGRTLSVSSRSPAMMRADVIASITGLLTFPKAIPRNAVRKCCQSSSCAGIQLQCSPFAPPGPAPLFVGAKVNTLSRSLLKRAISSLFGAGIVNCGIAFSARGKRVGSTFTL